jgi:hypothetical protein
MWKTRSPHAFGDRGELGISLTYDRRCMSKKASDGPV